MKYEIKDLEKLMSDVLFGTRVEYYGYHSPNLYIDGFTTSDFPMSDRIMNDDTITNNTIKTLFQDLDDKIFKETKRLRDSFIYDKKTDSFYDFRYSNHGIYRTEWRKNKYKNPDILFTKSKIYDIKNNKIDSFIYGDYVYTFDDVKYTFIKWEYKNNRLLYVIQDDRGGVKFICHSLIKTKPTTSFNIKFNTHFYNEIKGKSRGRDKLTDDLIHIPFVKFIRLNITSIHSSYQGDVLYNYDSYIVNKTFDEYDEPNKLKDCNVSEDMIKSFLKIKPKEYYLNLKEKNSLELSGLEIELMNIKLEQEFQLNSIINVLSINQERYKNAITQVNEKLNKSINNKIRKIRNKIDDLSTKIDAIELMLE